MPRILELKEIDGRLAVFLERPAEDEGSVTLWTEAEKDAARKALIERCATIALEQRCERDTPWDLACTTIANKIRTQTDSE